MTVNLELLGFGSSGLRILETNSGNNFNQTASLPFFGKDSISNSQNSLVEDFDGDGKGGYHVLKYFLQPFSSRLSYYLCFHF
ncbi:MAG: hypothetical protein IPM38_16315 [Ignavibacteria bacterium]|nr:hypothetical protein [Ignavibacteria bacterium]